MKRFGSANFGSIDGTSNGFVLGVSYLQVTLLTSIVLRADKA
jgi:hypothetical protein